MTSACRKVDTPVRDDDVGLAQTLGHEALEYPVLGLRVHGGKRVVKDQYLRIYGEGAGDGDALFLPARQGEALLADHGLPAIRKTGNIPVNRGDGGHAEETGFR